MKKSTRTTDSKMTANCMICKKSAEMRDTIACSGCDSRYHFDCSGTSEKLYQILSSDAKKQWKCKNCIHKVVKQNKIKENIQHGQVSNVTKRRKLTSAKSKNDVIETFEVHSSDITIPELESSQGSPSLDSRLLSDDDCNTSTEQLSKSMEEQYMVGATEDLRRQINVLTSDLLSTQNELENTICENNSLKKTINKLTQELHVLKNICKSPAVLKKSSSTTPKRKRQSINIHDALSLDVTPKPSVFTIVPGTSCERKANIWSATDKENLDRIIKDLQAALIESEAEIVKLKKQIETLDAKLICMASNSTKQESHKPAHEQRKRLISKAIKPNNNENTSTIRIFGGNQCVGLASCLLHSRYNTNYDKYKVSSKTKPNASTGEILYDCQSVTPMPTDKIVISFGEHDCNPTSVLTELRRLIENFRNVPIIILNVTSNKFINVYKLNDEIYNLIRYYNNCYFLRFHANSSLLTISKKINLTIDSIDYDRKYLDVNEIKKHVLRDIASQTVTLNNKKYRKGTIPYLFAKAKIDKSKDESGFSSDNPQSKRGTIPFYFPFVEKSKLFRP